MGAAAFQRRSVMEQSTLPISRNVSLERLVHDALGEIERLGYSRRSRNRYRTTWEHLIEFSCGKGLGDQFSSELAEEAMLKNGAGRSQFTLKVLAKYCFGGPQGRAWINTIKESAMMHVFAGQIFDHYRLVFEKKE